MTQGSRNEGGDGIVRIMVLEFTDCDSAIFDEIMEVVNCHPDIEYDAEPGGYTEGDAGGCGRI